MHAGFLRKILTALGAGLVLWLGIKYLLPVLLPFALGGLLALSAEPAVGFGVSRLKLPRAISSGLGVALTLVLVVGILSLLGALAVKELGQVAQALPDVQGTVQQGMVLLQDFLVGLTARMPEGVRNLAAGTVLELFDSGKLLNQTAGKLPQMVTSVLGKIPGSALGIGTGILSGFMISVRLPRLRERVAARLPKSWREEFLPALSRMRRALGQWLKAQGKLMAVTYGIVAIGFLLLRIRYGLIWAALVALVDAVPVLGTGTVLIPWAVVLLLQKKTLQGIGLLGIYGAALLTRTVLEPKLVGKHLGLDPLLTLLFLYVGYRFLGIFGMILAPMVAAAAKSLISPQEGETPPSPGKMI